MRTLRQNLPTAAAAEYFFGERLLSDGIPLPAQRNRCQHYHGQKAAEKRNCTMCDETAVCRTTASGVPWLQVHFNLGRLHLRMLFLDKNV